MAAQDAHAGLLEGNAKMALVEAALARPQPGEEALPSTSAADRATYAETELAELVAAAASTSPAQLALGRPRLVSAESELAALVAADRLDDAIASLPAAPTAPPVLREGSGRADGAAGGATGADATVGGVASVELFVPGRLCLLGEHSDWAGGFRSAAAPHVWPGATLVVGLSHHGLHATARQLLMPTPRVLRLTSTLHTGERVGPVEIPLELDALKALAAQGGFFSYAAGTAAAVLAAHGGRVTGGMEIDNHTTTLPHAVGLSSSAAHCVLVARSFSRVFDLGLTPVEEMELAYRGERMTPSLCGRMDQAGCAFGSVPVLIRFDGDAVSVTPLVVGAPMHLVVSDLVRSPRFFHPSLRHSQSSVLCKFHLYPFILYPFVLTTLGYIPQGKSKCTTTILTALRAVYPGPPEPGTPGEALHSLLGPLNAQFVESGASAVAAGDAPALGATFAAAQAAFDAAAAPLCPSQLMSPALHAVLSEPRLARLVTGGKGVGSQGDGCVQFVCASEGAQADAAAVLKGHCGLPRTFFVTLRPPARGAGAAPPADDADA